MKWTSAKLEDVAYVFNGKTPSKAEQKIQGHPVLKIKNVDDKRRFKGTFESFVDINVAAKSESKLIELNDTLILNAAHNADYVGSKQYRAELEVVNSLPTGEWLIVRKKGDMLDSIYLNHWLRLDATRFQIKHLVKGIHLYPKDVARLTIPLPPLEEQKKIAAILDAADALRQKDAQLIAKYNALSQSLFLDMFGDPVTNPMGWEAKDLGSICGVGSSKRVFTKDLVNQGIPFFRGTEIGRLGEDLQIKPTLFITQEHYDKLKEQTGVPQKGDLLLPSICPDGRIFIVQDLQPFYFKDGRVLWIKVDKSNVNSLYLKVFLKQTFHTNYASIASGTTFAELKIVALKKIKTLVPPITLQNQFAERTQAIEAQKQQAQTSLQKSEDLFNSLLQRAFKGELTA